MSVIDIYKKPINELLISDPHEILTVKFIEKIWKYFRLYDPSASHLEKPSFDAPEYSKEELVKFKQSYEDAFKPLFMTFIKFDNILLMFVPNRKDEYDAIMILKQGNDFKIFLCDFDCNEVSRINTRSAMDEIALEMGFEGRILFASLMVKE